MAEILKFKQNQDKKSAHVIVLLIELIFGQLKLPSKQKRGTGYFTLYNYALKGYKTDPARKEKIETLQRHRI